MPQFISKGGTWIAKDKAGEEVLERRKGKTLLKKEKPKKKTTKR